MKLVLVDYGAGNIRSAQRALHVVGADIANFEVVVSHKPEDILSADRIVMPGDGAYPDCRDALAHSGAEAALQEAVTQRGVPFLGICVGMQLLSTIGLEHRPTAGLNWIGGTVKHLELPDPTLKIPHMGWNTLEQHRPHPLLDGIPLGQNGLHAFFLHSFHFMADETQNVIATTHYGMPITAIVAKDNIAGVQFHPEKSQKLGLTLLHNFIGWTP